MIFDPCINDRCNQFGNGICYSSIYCPDYIPYISVKDIILKKEEVKLNMSTFPNETQNMTFKNEAGTNTTTAASYDPNTTTHTSCVSYCQYRLPCGICEKLKAPCLKQNNTTITWTSQTTNAGGTNNG